MARAPSVAGTPRVAGADGSARAHSAAPPNARPARAALAPGEPARAVTQPQTATSTAAATRPNRTPPKG
ncbi:hypothetical protein [Actinophytocola sp.]|uniref:hypothetical protein n=1 Tax=Actinophytocola sp. TaxID=1872138 RepID=UPI002D5D216B|nr:hypothetical protein [Actinophytocola sp.]HYQ63400.1 hypothetical protein [Actinophytocola sp.]